MDLSRVNLESSREAARCEREKESLQEQGEEVKLSVSLPGGERVVQSFKVGVTVAYVKAQLAQQHGIDFAKLKLLLGGRALLDPLSLADCPGVAPGQEVAVEAVVS